MTTNGYYRAWIGLRLPLGEFNKMYNYSIDSVVDAYKLKELAEKSYKDVEVVDCTTIMTKITIYSKLNCVFL